MLKVKSSSCNIPSLVSNLQFQCHTTTLARAVTKSMIKCGIIAITFRSDISMNN